MKVSVEVKPAVVPAPDPTLRIRHKKMQKDAINARRIAEEKQKKANQLMLEARRLQEMHKKDMKDREKKKRAEVIVNGAYRGASRAQNEADEAKKVAEQKETALRSIEKQLKTYS